MVNVPRCRARARGRLSHDASFNNVFRYAFGVPMALGGAAFLAVGLYGLFVHTHVTDDSGRRRAKAQPALTLGPTGLEF